MASRKAQRKVQEATYLLQKGDLATALQCATEATQADATLPEGFQLCGIALSRLGRTAEATEAFRTARDLAPYVAKHVYNLAVNLRTRGLDEEALTAATAVVALEPNHAGARQLLEELGAVGLPPLSASQGSLRGRVRPGYGEPTHILPFLQGMEKAWNFAGYLFVGIAAVLAILMFAHLPMGPIGAATKGKLPDIGLRQDPLSIFVTYLYILSSICTFMWMLVDIVDRRQKFSWMVPVLACGTLGMNVLPLSLYIFAGRRMGAEPPAEP